MISIHKNLRDLGEARHYRDNFDFIETSDIERVAAEISTFAWSPIRWRNGKSLQSEFVSAHLCVLDFDNGVLSLEQARKNFCDSIHIIGITKSHQVLKNNICCDRFRVVLKFEEVITDLAKYRATMSHYVKLYDADPACIDGARFFWPCTDLVSIDSDGYERETFEPIAKNASPVDYSSYREKKFIPHFIEGILKFGCPDGSRNTTCFKLGIYLTKCGYSEREIIDMIMHSPVPVDQSVRPEVEEAVRNGAKRGRRENKAEEEKNFSRHR